MSEATREVMNHGTATDVFDPMEQEQPSLTRHALQSSILTVHSAIQAYIVALNSENNRLK